jgi:hypothetical protein
MKRRALGCAISLATAAMGLGYANWERGGVHQQLVLRKPGSTRRNLHSFNLPVVFQQQDSATLPRLVLRTLAVVCVVFGIWWFASLVAGFRWAASETSCLGLRLEETALPRSTTGLLPIAAHICATKRNSK